MRRPTVVLAVMALSTSLAFTACSDDSESSAVCDSADDLESDLSAITDVDVRADGVDALGSAVQDAEDAATNLADEVGDELQPEVDALQAALSDLGSAIQGFSSDGLQPVTTAIGDVGDAGTALIDDVESSSCD
jgi:hypothetical protein